MNLARSIKISATLTFLVALFSLAGVMHTPWTSSRKSVGIARPSTPQGANPAVIDIQLSDGTGVAPASETAPPAKATRISDEEAKKILARLEPLPPGTGDPETTDFAKRDPSRPAPRPGTTISHAFPPPDPDRGAPDVAQKDLEVTRYGPEGDLRLADKISITFSQPMVPLTSLETLADSEIPVTMEPHVKGRWRWVSPKTLVFRDQARMPMATEFKVRVPAGITSANGNELRKAVQWRFSTPTVKPVGFHPYSHTGQPRDVIMAVAFNQRIDPAKVLPVVRVAKGKQGQALELVAEADWRGDSALAAFVDNHKKDQVLVFRSRDLLPADSRLTVTVGPGTPSREGPLKADGATIYNLRTYGALKVVEHRCGWGECRPFTPFSIRFSNPLDETAYADDWISVEPAIPDMNVSINNAYLTISGATKADTVYTVRLHQKIRDVYGQSMSEPEELKFKVGQAYPQFFWPAETIYIPDPYAKPGLPMYSINYRTAKIRVAKVDPVVDWPKYREYLQHRHRPAAGKPFPGSTVYEKTLNLKAAPNELHEIMLDLGKWLGDGKGHLVIEVRPDKLFPGQDANHGNHYGMMTWVQATHIGLDAFSDDQSILGWASHLKDGTPLKGVQLELYRHTAKVQGGDTDADGLHELDMIDSGGGQLLLARKGTDSAFLVPHLNHWGNSGQWNPSKPVGTLRWHIFNDRGMYKPGEKVRIKGWIRGFTGGRDGRLAMPGKPFRLDYHLLDARGNKFLEGDLDVGKSGGFHLEIPIPDDANLGPARVMFRTKDTLADFPGVNATQHGFQIQEFRRPEFEVSMTTDPGPHFAGGATEATVRANYYAGGSLPNAPVSWRVEARATHFTPPNWSQFTFGFWTPWWVHSGNHNQPDRYLHHNGITNSSGEHSMHLAFRDANSGRPTAISLAASVTDVNAQQWSANGSLLVHAGSLYVGLQSERYFVEKGTPFFVEAIAVDLDGKPVKGKTIDIFVHRTKWKRVAGTWTEIEVDPQEFQLQSDDKPVGFRFETKEGGTYRVRAEVRDDAGRRNETRMTRWVSGGRAKPIDKVEQESLTLIPSKKTFKPGEKASILVQAPFFPAHGVMTVRHGGIVDHRSFELKTPSITLDVPIEVAHIPQVTIQVDLTGANQRLDASGEPDPKLPPRPAFASGSLNLDVPAAYHELKVALDPESPELQPGESTTLSLTVTDRDNKPVAGSEVAVFVVDEAILALSGYRLANPLHSFYRALVANMLNSHNRGWIVLADPTELAKQQAEAQPKMELMESNEALSVKMNEVKALEGSIAPAAPAMASPKMKMAARNRALDDIAEGEAESQPIAVRSNFSPLAAYFPDVKTDGAGKATVTIDMPDNLTRYRIMAVAVKEAERYGIGESNLTARMPLMVRPSAPRFLNFGDRFELPVVVQNQSDRDLEVRVAAEAANATFTAGLGRRVVVPAKDRVEVLLPAKTDLAGKARFRIAAVSGKAADAAMIEVPVWTPATSEAFAVYGEIDESGAIAQPVAVPDDVFPQFGGLEVSTTSTALHTLTDAVLYLTNYPYDCAEQRASRIMGIVTLEKVLREFGADLDPDKLRAVVEKDVEALSQTQNGDGGFGFWRRGEKSWPYLSIHVAHALIRARQHDVTVPDRVLDNCQRYLRQFERDNFPRDWSKRSRFMVKAYALYVRALNGDPQPRHADKVLAMMPIEDAPMEGLGWLLSVYKPQSESARKLLRHFNNRADETAATAQFTDHYGDDAYLILHSSRRTDAVILEGLIGAQRDNPLIPKVVAGLLGHRTKGRWTNTQENAFVLLAIKRYFDTYEATTPDFVARVWLGEAFAGEHAYRGRSAERHQVDIPMAWLTEQTGDSADLIVDKQGAGRLYYRLGMNYAPRDLNLKPLDRGFYVKRRYEAVDDPGDVVRQADGSWTIKRGAKVRVFLEMVAPARRYHVALVDPLPAGLESLNPSLAVTNAVDTGAKRPGWYWTWYRHQNLRDERTEAFTTYLWGGVHEYSYLARATTPGSFVVPPAKAEEMYAPETFGRSATDRVIIR